MRHRQRTRPMRRRATAAVLLALAMVLAACGAPGGDEAAPVTPETPEPTDEDPDEPEPDMDREPIRIGFLAPTTGGVAASGQDMLNGWNLFWDQHGLEVAGTPIESIHRDTAGDPAVALTVSEELVNNAQIDMAVGPLLANVGLAVGDYLGREGIPAFMPVVSADDMTQRDRIDGVIRIAGWTSSQTTHPFGEWAYDQGYRTVVTFCADYAFGHENCGGFANTFTDRRRRGHQPALEPAQHPGLRHLPGPDPVGEPRRGVRHPGRG
jgi:branched-chain amino acid transport system substrate-binding protein